MSNNPFWAQQQQLFDMWNENMSKMPGMSAYTDMYKKMMPGAEQYWNQFTNAANNAQSADPMKAFQNMPGMDMFKNMPGMDMWKNMPGMDMWKPFFDKMPNMNAFGGINPFANLNPFSNLSAFSIPGMDNFTQLFDLWKNIGNPAEFMKDYPQKYMNMMQDMFKNFLPAGVQSFMAKPQEFMNTLIVFYKQVLDPWMQLDQELVQRAASGDMNAWQDFYIAFADRYEETFAKVFTMAGMGLNREANEDYMNAMNSYIKAMFSTGSLMSLIMDACKKSAEGILETYQKNVAEGKMVSTFMDFYKLWYKVTEDYLEKLLETDEFSKAFGEFSDLYAKYMVNMNKVYERMLSGLPIPTNTDMKSLYKTVYDLRKDVRDLKKAVEAAKAPKK